MKRNFAFFVVLTVLTMAFVACSAGSGTNPYVDTHGENEKNTSSSIFSGVRGTSDSEPESENGILGVGNTSNSGMGGGSGGSVSMDFLQGAASGSLVSQKHLVCPVGDSEVSLVGDCKVYSNGATSSFVFGGSASDGLDWMSVSLSLIGDFHSRGAKLRVVVNTSGPNAVGYDRELIEEMCEDIKRDSKDEKLTCGTNTLVREGSMRSNLTQSEFVDYAIGQCEMWCNYF